MHMEAALLPIFKGAANTSVCLHDETLVIVKKNKSQEKASYLKVTKMFQILTQKVKHYENLESTLQV